MLNFLTAIPYIILIFTGIYFMKLLGCFLKIREHKLWFYLSLPISCAVVQILIHPNEWENAFLCFILFLLLLFVFFNGHPIQKLSVAFIVYPIIISLNFLAENIGLNLWIVLGRNEYLSQLIRSGFHMLYFLFYLGIYKVFQKELKNAVRYLDLKLWSLLLIICLAPLAAIVSFVCFTPDIRFAAYPAAFACIITNIGCVSLTVYLASSAKAYSENRNLRLQQEYYIELEQNQDVIRKLRHDMNNHLSVVATLIMNDEKEHLSEYFDGVRAQFAVNTRSFCENSIVNAVLNAKYNLAVHNNIDCTFHIEMGHISYIDDISLCTLFANTLDNAIEACLKLKENRFISVKARNVNDTFCYEITNSKANEIIEKNGKITTDKIDNKSHGFGLSIIRELVENYSGTIDITYTSDKFCVLIVICV